MHLLAVLAGQPLQSALIAMAGVVPAALFSAGDQVNTGLPPVLTLLTSLFVHAGWMHLLFNMMFLAFVGQQVEWVLGPRRLVLLYLAGGVVGGLGEAVTRPESTVPVIGASGAVAAVFAAYATLFARRRAQPQRVMGFHLSGGLINALQLALVWIGLQLATALAFNGPDGGIAIWAHIGGFITGLVLIPLYARLRLK